MKYTCGTCGHVGYPMYSGEIDSCPLCENLMYTKGDLDPSFWETVAMTVLLVGLGVCFLITNEGLVLW